MIIYQKIKEQTTGIRVNRTADDPSQLGFDTQIRGLNQASRNALNGILFIQVGEGYLQETQDIIHRLRVLATHSRIHDANIAEETVSYASDSILTQAGEAMLAQANMRPQSILQILR